ncbi:MAG: xanthine dehydrogenase family protein molybdopterin-binding subunit [Spirochaetaceae bacterium]|nr:MAG: xanthine dehydrogenase family protein molybdopterin-binding subunit [Spirochaetaceae bacterium]
MSNADAHSGITHSGIIGRPINRVGGPERVDGTYRYVGDIKIPNVLHTRLVHLDCGRARIHSVDTSAALQMPGVRAILSGKELPASVKRFGPANRDRPILAIDETTFHGEPVAIVAADTVWAAAQGAAAVVVDYQELPGIYTVEDALAPGAALVQDPALRPNSAYKETNILNEWKFGWGAVDSAEADLVVENDYTFPMMTQFAIEPFTYAVEPTSDGITVYSAIQHPNYLQRVIAEFLDMPLSRVRVIAPDPGGAFGGKQHAKFEPLLAYLALRIGRPLRLELTLEESFQAARRTSAQAHIRTGFQRNGTLVFQDVEINYLIGAYEDIAGRLVAKGSYAGGGGPYRIPNVRILARGVFSNTVPSTAMRGFGLPQMNWPVECQIDEAARELGIDPVELRMKNLPEYGEVFMPQDPPADGRWAETLRKGADAIGWGKPLPPGRGRGISMGLKLGPTTGASYAIVRLHGDGSATVLAGTSDMGQGARTVYTQIAAHELGLSPQRIMVVMGDTQGVPFDLQTSASRSAVFMGNAVLRACRDVARQVQELAAEHYKADAVIVEPGTVEVGGQRKTFDQVMTDRFSKVKGEVIGSGSARAEYDETHPLNGRPAFYEVTCTAVEIEVDKETGVMVFHKLVTVADVGRALNSQHVAMQDDGGAIQGLGHTVMEQYFMDDRGRVRNLGALDYRIPTTMDTPRELISLHVENGDGPGPYGAKGAAEGGILAVSPAVAAAVCAATGAMIRELPLTPQRIWEALHT